MMEYLRRGGSVLDAVPGFFRSTAQDIPDHSGPRDQMTGDKCVKGAQLTFVQPVHQPIRFEYSQRLF